MALDATELFVAGSGHVWSAPEGTAMPAVATQPAAPWIEHGYTTEDGVTGSWGKDTDDVMAWQSALPLRKLVTGMPMTVKFALLQMNEENLMFALGGGTVATGVYTPPPMSSLDFRALLIEGTDGTDTARFMFYRCMLNAAVEMQLTRTSAVTLELEFAVLGNDPAPYEIQIPASWSTGAGLLAADGQAANDKATAAA